jgi:hypothetical protein
MVKVSIFSAWFARPRLSLGNYNIGGVI